MLPRPLSSFILVLLWLAGAAVYFIIELWLVHVPGCFNWAPLAGEYVAKLSLAFTTAFPFWFVQQRLLKRQVRLRTAKQQRIFLDKVSKVYNDRVEEILLGSKLLIRPSPAHLFITPWHEVVVKSNELQRAKKGWVELFPRTMEVYSKQLRAYGNSMTPYLSNFSFEFNEKLEWVIRDMELHLVRGKMVNEEHYFEYALGALESVGKNTLLLENIYRVEHKIPRMPSPNTATPSV